MKRRTPFTILCCIALVVLVSVVVIAGRSSAKVEDKAFYVSPVGDDSNLGTESQPFKALGRAWEAIRKYKAERHRLPQGGLTVFLHGGDLMTESLVLGPEDSGTATAPIRWSGMPGEEPRLIGGNVVTEWHSSFQRKRR
jgi:hypothetical protein